MAVIKSGASADNLTVDAASKAARATLYNVSGNAMHSLVNVDGNESLAVAMTQNVWVSTKNSSTANINAGVTWEGPKTIIGGCESTLGIVGIQVNSFMDKKHTVTVWQSMDGINWDYSDSHAVPANYGVSRTVQAIGAYFYVSVKNETAANSTVCRIGTCLCPVVEALPRSLTTGGNLKVTPSAEWQNNRLTTGVYAVSSFRAPGRASAPQNLFTIFNPAASAVNVAIRGLSINSDSTGALTSVTPMMKLSRATNISGGTILVAGKFQTSQADPVAVCRGDSSADDTSSAGAIVATAGVNLWTQNFDRLHSIVGWTTHSNYNMIPDVGTDLRQILLVPGEALLIQAPTTNILATTSFIINCSWLEYAAV